MARPKYAVRGLGESLRLSGAPPASGRRPCTRA